MTKELINKKIQDAKESCKRLREIEMECLKDTMKFCTDGKYDFNTENRFPPYCIGVTHHVDFPVEYRIDKVVIDDNDDVQIFGSPIICNEAWDMERITTRLRVGEIHKIASEIFIEWC